MYIFKLTIFLTFISLASVAVSAESNLPTCYDFGDLAEYYIADRSKNYLIYDQSSGLEFLSKTDKSNIRFVIRFLGKECARKNGDFARHSTRTPSQIIDQDYSSGRYYFHVKWERDIVGSNWRGRVAYSDFSVGDSVRSKANLFLVCDLDDAFPCMEISVGSPKILHDSDIKWLLNKISKIKFLSDE